MDKETGLTQEEINKLKKVKIECNSINELIDTIEWFKNRLDARNLLENEKSGF